MGLLRTSHNITVRHYMSFLLFSCSGLSDVTLANFPDLLLMSKVAQDGGREEEKEGERRV